MRKWFSSAFIALFFALWITPAEAAIVRGATAYFETTVSMAVDNATDIILCGTWAGADQNTGVAFNGDAFTLMDKQQVGASNERVHVWQLVAPDVGNYTLSRTMSGGASFQGRCAVYEGAEQALATGTAIDKDSQSTSSLSLSVTSITDDSWTFAQVRSTGGNVTDGTNCVTPLPALTDDGIAACDSDAATGTAGATTIQMGGATTIAAVGVAFAPLAEEEEPPPEETTESATGTIVYQTELQNFIHGWAVILMAFAIAVCIGWRFWKG